MNSPRLRTAYSPLFAWEDCTFVNQFVTRSGVGHPDNFFLEGACAGRFRYRGHPSTDSDGSYRFHTILPALYPGRTRHYHIKVQAPERPILTTQLYFPDEPANRRDGLFRRELVMRIAEAPDNLTAHFDLVLDMR
jgi:protocatechuate 3,4-dioxygenase beta subunit